jgi:hypothetical protein
MRIYNVFTSKTKVAGGVLIFASILTSVVIVSSLWAQEPASSLMQNELKRAPGWVRQSSSLLLYGEDGSIVQELSLHNADPVGTNINETIGGASPDGRLAWTLERHTVWNPSRTKILQSQRLLKAIGTSGQELWRDDSADNPERGEAIQFSSDGKTILLARHPETGWLTEIRNWMGQPLFVLGPYPKLISMTLTPNGRYALVRWGVQDKSDTHTFVDVLAKKSKDIPSSELVLGIGRIDDQGTVKSGSKTLFTFSNAVSSATAIPHASTDTFSPAK